MVCLFRLHIIFCRLLENVSWVATTADCWSAHNKSFLGMTVHWIDAKTLQRKHAVLACSRLRGHHTFDVLAQAIVDTHYKYHIENKVITCTTDNGSNFVKAFVEFGCVADVLPQIDQCPDAESEEVSREDDSEPDSESDDVAQLEYISVNAVLDEPTDLGLKLPIHMRCAAHTFNLVATADAAKSLESGSFKSIYCKSMGKARALWNLQSRSTVVADSIQQELGRRLVLPTTTRWNSTYDAVVVLNNVLETKKASVHRLMTQLKLKPFTDSEVDFLKEYASVMTIVSRALDKIQGEDQAYLGCLLPIVATTVLKLRAMKSKRSQYCDPLVNALLDGIQKRFGPLLDDQQCQLAAAFHPRFRLLWLEQYDNTQLIRVRNAMETMVETALVQMETQVESNCNIELEENDVEDDFFSSITQHNDTERNKSPKSKARDIINDWLNVGSKSIESQNFMGEKTLVQLFLKLNTAIPSSAAVERLFSLGRDILRDKRASLSDKNFERLMFLKGNNHIVT